MTLQSGSAAALVAIKLAQVVEPAALLAEPLPDSFSDDAGDLEVVLTDFVAVVVLLQACEVCEATIDLACWRTPRLAGSFSLLVPR